jgi:hypothetical protein
MIVFDLHCPSQHTFEGWFGSADDFESQLGRGLVQCPLCDSKEISKRLSAPRINLGAAAPASDAVPVEKGRSLQVQNQSVPALSDEAAKTVEKMQTLWLEMAQHIVANTEDVGSSFAEEARKIHYKETPDRNIRGVTSPDEAASLVEEGINVHSFPLPASLKGPLQ